MTKLAYEHVMMEKDLREGINNGDFEVYYQPQVNAKTGKITGLEALVRWHHPVAGILSPDSFMEPAEKTGIITIDDFGTGYSSLSHLKCLPIDKLKIDKSFIKDIPEDSTAKTIVNTMIILAESLHLEVIAEGVETEAQHSFLLENGCFQIQGHYYSEAVTAKEIESMLRMQSD